MTRKQQEVEQLQQQISKLQDQIFKLQMRIHQLEKKPEYDEEEPLLNFPDFPGNGSHGNNFTYAIYNAAKEKSATLGSPWNITIGDLVRLTPEELLFQRGFGPKCLKKLQEWMHYHDLEFIGD